jgi:hypothetical protein
MSNSQLTNTPTEISIGGKKYQMSALTDKDMAELDEFAQAKLIDNARRSLPDDCTDKIYNRMMALAMRESLGISYARPPGSKIFSTTYGLARLAWQGIKRNQPDVTVDEIHTAMGDDVRNMLEIQTQFRKVNRLPDSEPAVKGKGNGEANAQSFQENKSTLQSSV